MSLSRGESVLDVGCGTGLLLEMMAGLVGDSGRVTGLDFSADMLEFAQSRCDGLAHTNLMQGSAENLDLDADLFDVLTCTQVLLYVENVRQAMAEMFRVLKPGGQIAILETDWRSAILNSSDPALTRKIFDAWDQSVPSPNLPPELPTRLRQSGFNNVSVTAIPIINSSYTPNCFSAGMLKLISRQAVEKQACDQTESRQWYEQLMALAEQDSYFFSVNRFLFTAVKPG
ncbi:MAG: arsenite methyltransferase [Gammaproteobacteria bacterium]